MHVVNKQLIKLIVSACGWIKIFEYECLFLILSFIDPDHCHGSISSQNFSPNFSQLTLVETMPIYILTIFIFELCNGIDITVATDIDILLPHCEETPVYKDAFTSSCNNSLVYFTDDSCSTTCSSVIESTCSCVLSIGFGKF